MSKVNNYTENHILLIDMLTKDTHTFGESCQTEKNKTAKNLMKCLEKQTKILKDN